MTQRTSFAARIAITITRVFPTMGLALGLLLGASGGPQPAAARPILLGDAALPTPAVLGRNLEPVRSEGFTKAGFRSHRGFRRGFSKGGRGFRGHRFGGHGFGKRRFFGHGFRSHRFGGHGFGKHGFKRPH